MPSPRLVLHADDFGMNRAVNDGIVRGFREGLLTSTSLMANAPDVDRALEKWKELAADRAIGRLPSGNAKRKLGDPDSPFDLGIHLNLTQGRPLGGDRYPAELLDSEGRFPSIFALFARLWRSGDKFQAAVRDEWQRQIEVLCDHGLRPTHVNGHQYVEMLPIAAGIVPELVERYAVKSVRVALEPALFRDTVLHRFNAVKWPLGRVKRSFAAKFKKVVDSRGISHPDAFYGTVHAGGIDLPLLGRFLSSGRECGLVEVGLHPAEAADAPSPKDEADGWRDPLADARPGELQMLVSAELPRLLESSGWRLGRLQQTGYARS